MSDRCDSIEENLNNFKDAYVKNNKEFLQLSFYVNEMRDTLKDHIIRRDAEEKEFRDQMKPVLDFFNGVTFTKKLLLGVVGALAAVIGLVIMFKKLLQ